MSTILPFSEFKNNLKVKPELKKALIDTCALISLSHDSNEFHDEALEMFSYLKKENVKAFSNVNIRSEYIDYHRRIIITEALTFISSTADGITSYSEIYRKLKSHRAEVQKRADKDNPLVLNDSKIKYFKKLLSFSHEDISNTWLYFCSESLSGYFENTFTGVENFLKLQYLSLRKGEVSPEVTKDVSWEEMYAISEKSGLGISDSMILNMFESTSIPFLITTDFDLVYASAISDNTKLVFCPDRIYQDYKDKYFRVL